MQFYDLRKEIIHRIETYLATREEQIKNNIPPMNWSFFETKMVREYGATPKMVRKLLETILPGAEVKDGDIRKRES